MTTIKLGQVLWDDSIPPSCWSSQSSPSSSKFWRHQSRQHHCSIGVTFNSMLFFAPHVQKVASKAAASLYALRILTAHSLDGQALWEVTQATLVAQLLYASSAWSGFVKSEERTKLQLILDKASRYGIYQRISEPLPSYLNHQMTSYLIHSVINNPDHVLCSLLPPSRNTGYNLRKLNHGLSLPTVHSITA